MIRSQDDDKGGSETTEVHAAQRSHWRRCADCGGGERDKRASVKVGPGPRIILCLDCLDKRNAGVVPVG